MLISLLKASIIRTFQGFDEKHLQSYLNAFCYRFNRRRLRDEIFSRLLAAVTTSQSLGMLF